MYIFKHDFRIAIVLILTFISYLVDFEMLVMLVWLADIGLN